MQESRYPGLPTKGETTGHQHRKSSGHWLAGIVVPAGVQLFHKSLFHHVDGENYITWRAGNEDANIFFPYIKMDALEA